MINPSIIEAPLPKGVADFLPEKADKIGYIEGKIRRVFELWGFRRIITPLLEFHDVMALGMGDDLKERTFRFDDRQTGRLLAIPPDITPQVARIVATRMKGYPLPHRLYYNGRVLRHAEIQSGRSREIFQAGVELMGLDSPEADAEMVAMAVEAMQGLGLAGFKMDLGQVEFFRGVMAASGLAMPVRKQLQEAIAKKDVSAVALILEKEPVADAVKEEIAALPRLFGGREVLEQAERVAGNDRSRRALDNIAQVLDILDIYRVSDYLSIDLGEIRGLDYHTGLTFEGFVEGLGFSVGSGGRYDNLIAHFGPSIPAVGFAIGVERVLMALRARGTLRGPVVRATVAPDVVSAWGEDFARVQAERARGGVVEVDILSRSDDELRRYAQIRGAREIWYGDGRTEVLRPTAEGKTP